MPGSERRPLVRIAAAGIVFKPLTTGVKKPFRRGVIAAAVRVGGHHAHRERGAARLARRDHIVNEFPIVLALLRLDVCPVEPDVGDRARETRAAIGIALLTHPPLAGIGE